VRDLAALKKASQHVAFIVSADVESAVRNTSHTFTNIINRVENLSSTLAAVITHSGIAAGELAKAQTAVAAALQGQSELQRELQCLRSAQWEVCSVNLKADKNATSLTEAVLDVTVGVESYLVEAEK